LDAQAQGDANGRYVNELGMEFVLVPAGTFTMGSPRREPGHEEGEGRHQHEVRITRPYFIGVCPVTGEQYAKVMGGDPSKFRGQERPVDSVSWHDAVGFCARLSKDGRTYRLPTEAEWEYACRAGGNGAYCYGDDPADLDRYAWYLANAGDRTRPVGLKLPNAWGLHDVHGNVWEWCQDWYGPYAQDPSDDPAGPAEGAYRVTRGGSWFDYPLPLRCAARGRNMPANRSDDQGFRVVCLAVR
jgi:formylglycine-generating enzyme required for sulfatase activity